MTLEWIKINESEDSIDQLPLHEYILVTQGDHVFLAWIERNEEGGNLIATIANPTLKYRATATSFDYYARIEMPKE